MLLIRDLTLRNPDLVQLNYTEYKIEMILCEAQPEPRPPDFQPRASEKWVSCQGLPLCSFLPDRVSCPWGQGVAGSRGGGRWEQRSRGVGGRGPPLLDHRASHPQHHWHLKQVILLHPFSVMGNVPSGAFRPLLSWTQGPGRASKGHRDWKEGGEKAV